MRVGIPGHEYFFGSDKCLRKRFGWASGGAVLGIAQPPHQARRNCGEGGTGDKSPAEGILTNSDLALVAVGPASQSAGPPSEMHYQCFVNSTSFGHMKA